MTQTEFLHMVRQIDTEITPYATAPVLDHPIALSRVMKSRANPDRFLTTTTCYDDAMDFVDGIRKHHKAHNKSIKHWRLMHGVLSDAEGKETWGHAWVERNYIIYESRWHNGERVFSMTEKSMWVEVWRPQYVKGYTLNEAFQAMCASPLRNAGPWDPVVLRAGNHYAPADEMQMYGELK